MNNADLTFALVTPNNTADPNVIRVTNSKLPNVRLASYLDDNPKFAGQLHCEAKTGDERAERLCGKLLMGQDLTSADGYTGYLLDQEIDKATCDNASRSWSTSRTKCYKTTEERCTDLGMGVISGQENQCGYENLTGKTIGAEGILICSQGWACGGSVVKDGASCVPTDHHGCVNVIVENGGSCVANVFAGCELARIKDGGKCIANYPSLACNAASYSGTGCCEGEYCPSDAPKC
ncbi:MAG: hypothetical protein IKN49_06035, partial [Elusimicrobiaceae bacterium]|nr:hypothetical protein [Elusimicrobiaceae bacterium]